MEFILLGFIVLSLGYLVLDQIDEDLGRPKIKITFKL